MTDREKLIEILSVPIYPLIDTDPAEVVADYLMDNDVRPVRPVRHAHWVKDFCGDHYCSECINFALGDSEGYSGELLSDYCPFCGAEMDEGASDAE